MFLSMKSAWANSYILMVWVAKKEIKEHKELEI